MSSSVLPYVAVLLSALLMGTTLAHALEMQAKLHASATEWLTFQHTLYHSFATIGAVFELGSLVMAGAVAFVMRANRPVFRLAMTATVLLAVAFFGVWLGFTNPVNARTAAWTAGTIPADWTRWRTQWEYSHLVRFGLQLAAFNALTIVLMRVSRHAR